MAGNGSMTRMWKRVLTVRPNIGFTKTDVNPIRSGQSEVEAENVKEAEMEQEQWKTVKENIEELETNIAEQFEDEMRQQRGGPPIIKALAKPTRNEWERHQTTRTPFVLWCQHCLAARNVRRSRPSRGRKGMLVPDAETGEGPTKISFDYMYFHERVGKHRDMQHNLPYLLAVER